MSDQGQQTGEQLSPEEKELAIEGKLRKYYQKFREEEKANNPPRRRESSGGDSGGGSRPSAPKTVFQKFLGL